MTERSANVRVNVTGNAVAELGKIAKAEENVQKGARSADSALKKAGSSLDAVKTSASSAIPRINALSGANARIATQTKKTADSFDKGAKASLKMAVAYANTSNAAKRLDVDNRRLGESAKAASRSVDQLARSTDRVNASARSSANSRALTMWQQIAAAASVAAGAAGRLGRTRIDGRAAARYAGGAVSAAATAGLSISRQAQNVIGVRSQEDILSGAIDRNIEFIRTARGAGLNSAQRESIQNQAIDIGRRTGLGPEQIMSAIGQSQELFSGLASAQSSGTIPQFMRQIEDMGQVAMATGADLGDVVTASGEFQRQLNLSSTEASDALAILAQGAQDGSLNMADFAGAFPGILSQLANLRGQAGQGLGAVREFQAIAQGLKAGGVRDASVARTLQENLLNAFSNASTRRLIERAGVQVMENDTNADGTVRTDRRGRPIQRMRNTADIIADMARNDRFQGVNLAAIMHDAQARNAATILMGQEQRAASGTAGALTLAQRQATSLEGGKTLIADTNADIRSSASGKAVQARANREAAVYSQDDRLINAMVDVAGPLTGLQDEFPRLSMAVESLIPVLSALAPGLAASAGSSGGSTATTAAATAAGASAGKGGGGLLSALAVPAALAAVAFSAVNERREGGDLGRGGAWQTGEQRMWARLGNPMGIGLTPEQRAERNASGGRSSGQTHTPADSRATEENTRATQELTRTIRSNGSNAGNPATVTP